jgi:hypothetical protein
MPDPPQLMVAVVLWKLYSIGAPGWPVDQGIEGLSRRAVSVDSTMPAIAPADT